MLRTLSVLPVDILLFSVVSLGAENTFSHYYKGYMAGLFILKGKTESERVIRCLNNCKENLDFHAISDMSSGTVSLPIKLISTWVSKFRYLEDIPYCHFLCYIIFRVSRKWSVVATKQKVPPFFFNSKLRPMIHNSSLDLVISLKIWTHKRCNNYIYYSMNMVKRRSQKMCRFGSMPPLSKHVVKVAWSIICWNK